MLAEPRRKQKWSLNPRGKQWSEDSNKFGQKMLEKMGWTDGKGLGANEQGMTEHVRLAFKNDTAGIGFNKNNMDKAWTEHQDGFNHFLQQLQKSQDCRAIQKVEDASDGLSGKSLELKSKQSRARVHYQKFTRGKDVNKYSSKDLANIFGQKDLNVAVNAKKEEKTDVNDTLPIGSQDTRGGVITINSGNMADYFKNKSVKFQMIREKSISERAVESESEAEYVGFGCVSANTNNQAKTECSIKAFQNGVNYVFDNPCLDSPKNESTLKDGPKVSKKRKTEFTFENNGLGLDSPKATKNSKKLRTDIRADHVPKEGFINVALNLDSQPSESLNGKEFEVSRAQFGLANCALDITDEISEKKRVRFNDHVEYNTDSKKKKKKKDKARLDKFEVENKKNKKKRKQQDDPAPIPTGFVNKALDIEEVSDEVNDNQMNERKSKKVKRRKECRLSNLETIVEAPEEDKDSGQRTTEIENGTMEGCKLRPLHDNPNVNDNKTLEVNIKKKKKKKKKENEEDSALAVAIKLQDFEKEIKKEEEGTGEEELISAVEKKKKKKKKLKKDADFVGVNSASQLNITECEGNTDVCEINIFDTSQFKKLKNNKTIRNSDECVNIDLDEGLQDEKEISDKENTSKEPNTTVIKKSKKHKKYRKSEQSTLDNNDSLSHTAMGSNETLQADATKDAEFKGVSPNNVNSKDIYDTFKIVQSPWNVRARMSKKMLKALFHRNSISQFPGSNIHEIKGYGADIE